MPLHLIGAYGMECEVFMRTDTRETSMKSAVVTDHEQGWDFEKAAMPAWKALHLLVQKGTVPFDLLALYA